MDKKNRNVKKIKLKKGQTIRQNPDIKLRYFGHIKVYYQSVESKTGRRGGRKKIKTKITKKKVKRRHKRMAQNRSDRSIFRLVDSSAFLFLFFHTILVNSVRLNIIVHRCFLPLILKRGSHTTFITWMFRR